MTDTPAEHAEARLQLAALNFAKGWDKYRAHPAASNAATTCWRELRDNLAAAALTYAQTTSEKVHP